MFDVDLFIVEKVTWDNIVPAVADDVLNNPASPSVPVASSVANDTSARHEGGLLVKFVVVKVPIVLRPTEAVISEPNAVSEVAGAVVDVHAMSPLADPIAAPNGALSKLNDKVCAGKSASLACAVTSSD